jgi:hypothetical protein
MTLCTSDIIPIDPVTGERDWSGVLREELPQEKTGMLRWFFRSIRNWWADFRLWDGESVRRDRKERRGQDIIRRARP